MYTSTPFLIAQVVIYRQRNCLLKHTYARARGSAIVDLDKLLCDKRYFSADVDGFQCGLDTLTLRSELKEYSPPIHRPPHAGQSVDRRSTSPVFTGF
jgi:hypothetical protein